MLAGFRSRWMMPCSCAASSASAICFAIGSASSSGIGAASRDALRQVVALEADPSRTAGPGRTRHRLGGGRLDVRRREPARRGAEWPPEPAALPPEGAPSGCSWPTRRSQLDLGLQAEDARSGSTRTCPTRSAWAAAHDDDLGPDRLPDRAVEVQVRAARQVRACGSASCCRTRRRWSMTCASSGRCTPRPSTTSRPSRYMQTGNQITGRPAWGRGCPTAWARSTRTCRPSSCCVGQADEHRAGAGDLRAAVVGSGFSAGEHAGVVVPHRRRSDPVHQQSAGRARPRSAARRSTGSTGAQRTQLPTRSAIPRRTPAFAQYEMAFRMQTSVPELTDLAKETESDARALRRRRDRSPARSPTTASWPAGWSSAACASCRSTTTTGTSTATCRPACPTSAATSTSRAAALIQDLEAARHARRHARHLGRRIRPHDLLAGGADQGELRPRPSSALLHDVDGRRRRRRAARSTARPTTSPTTSSRTRSTSTTSTPRCCTSWASTTSGSPSSTRGSTSG